ncbi:hypothetical protein IFM89_018240 [Coptis chinensis]|uniref:Pentatricopeptide repeat-containing protein n=1 Tax=Coptis chinensis TaxID=261450 RepID=A0A835M0G7_9MAGN|nr:hypothetical protein IFM89_018240 [Coptis chinensis]
MGICTNPDTGNLNYAERIFRYIQDPSLFIYNLLIKEFTKKNMLRKSVWLFAQLREDRLFPDYFTYPFVLKAIGRLQMVSDGRKIHGLIIATGLEFDSYTRNSLMDMYADFGHTNTLQRLFKETLDKDIICWNILLSGYTRCRKFSDALLVYRQMEKGNGVRPDEATVVITLSVCIALQNLELGKELHYYISKELEFTTVLGNALMDMYAKCGSLILARQVFDEMQIKNVISWTTIVSGYVNCGKLHEARELFERSPTKDVVLWTTMINGNVQFSHFDEALALFNDMQNRKVKPDKFTVVTLLTGCAQLGALEQGRWVHGYIEDNNVVMDVVVSTALIDMYAKCGCMDKSLEIFRRTKKKDTASWTALICGFAMNGQTNKALELFSQMEHCGGKPDDITFIGVLSACSHGGLVEEGCCYFDSMKRTHKIEPKIEHYGCLVDLFGRAGLLDEAERLIDTIPNFSDDVLLPLWSSLLGACRIHRNVHMGERVARRILGMESSNSGIHSLAANLYAAADRWEDVTKVRRKMKDLGIKKTPGCSSIEVNGVFHEFLVADSSHPKARESYALLLDMLGLLLSSQENVIDGSI